MSGDVAIKVSGVSKSFKVPHEKHSSLKSAAINMFTPKSYTKFNALKDINLEIKRGEFFGIVGKNGSGKSTLLKILANIYQPTKGKIQINGTLAPFIELGVGFNPELTGRENVYLSGTILGMKKKKIESIYNDIVEFAELSEFMDQKLKNYSSGMQVRLAFSIAVRANSDILLIDEVLAVGDTAFQRKCFDIFDQYKASDKTIVLVTHDMGNVRRFCDRAALIKDGDLIKIDNPNSVATEYEKLNFSGVESNVDGNQQSGAQKNLTAKLTDSKGMVKNSFTEGDAVTITLKWQKNPQIQNIGVAIMKSNGEYIFGRNTLGQKNLDLSKTKTKSITIDLNLESGRYYLSFGTFGKTNYDIIDFVEKGPEFNIIPSGRIDWAGKVNLKNQWN